jgi:hypothetical protein
MAGRSGFPVRRVPTRWRKSGQPSQPNWRDGRRRNRGPSPCRRPARVRARRSSPPPRYGRRRAPEADGHADRSAVTVVAAVPPAQRRTAPDVTPKLHPLRMLRRVTGRCAKCRMAEGQGALAPVLHFASVRPSLRFGAGLRPLTAGAPFAPLRGRAPPSDRWRGHSPGVFGAQA